jgi:hypothetical protein
MSSINGSSFFRLGLGASLLLTPLVVSSLVSADDPSGANRGVPLPGGGGLPQVSFTNEIETKEPVRVMLYCKEHKGYAPFGDTESWIDLLSGQQQTRPLPHGGSFEVWYVYKRDRKYQGVAEITKEKPLTRVITLQHVCVNKTVKVKPNQVQPKIRLKNTTDGRISVFVKCQEHDVWYPSGEKEPRVWFQVDRGQEKTATLDHAGIFHIYLQADGREADYQGPFDFSDEGPLALTVQEAHEPVFRRDPRTGREYLDARPVIVSVVEPSEVPASKE